MDLTQYGTSPYADPRNRRQVQGFLPALLRGFLGQEEQGSVMEPGVQEARSTNDLGQGASVLSDLLPYGAAAKGAGKLAGLAGIFIGPKAKTWDKTAAALAESLRGLGKSPEAIRRATGVSWGADGLPRQEISDDLAQLRGAFLDKPTPRPLSENLEHPALYAAYPELLRMKSTVGFGPVGGEYHEGRILASAPDPSNAKSVVLHEAQHGIQELENFARGGSPSEFLKQAQWAAKARGLDPSWAEKKAYQDYLRLAGETEARMVQARRMLSPEERRQYAPEPDIPTHLQKVLRYRDTPAMSASAPVSGPASSISLLDLLRNAPEPKPLGLHDEYDFRVNPKDASVYVYRKGETPKPGYVNAVGWVGAEPVGGGKYWAEDVLVDKKHGKKGIATEMYQQLLDAGIPLTKSNDVTPEGQKMWDAWHRKGLAKNNEFIGKPK